MKKQTKLNINNCGCECHERSRAELKDRAELEALVRELDRLMDEDCSESQEEGEQ